MKIQANEQKLLYRSLAEADRRIRDLELSIMSRTRDRMTSERMKRNNHLVRVGEEEQARNYKHFLV